jgi:hypothetical protein
MPDSIPSLGFGAWSLGFDWDLAPWSLVIGNWSLVIGHWSLVIQQVILVQTSILR